MLCSLVVLMLNICKIHCVLFTHFLYGVSLK
nr:MAG TPA: hypothetical protein [Caudoviricetes sp.]